MGEGTGAAMDDMQQLAEAVASAVVEKYAELPKNGKPSTNEWTILAGLVASRRQSRQGEAENAPSAHDAVSVVALATGSKCLSASGLRQDGRALHDSHAEVLARRSFIHFLQSQLLLCNELGESAVSDGNCILAKSPRDDGRYCLKDGVSLHLFVSQAPCGDASIFSRDLPQPAIITGDDPEPHAMESKSPPSKRLKISTDDKRLVVVSDLDNRTGAKMVASNDLGNECKVAQPEGRLRTKPGRGEPTRSMSCSDKIARWNVLGLQGGMLSSILGPVYLDSVVVSEASFHQAALERAIAGRIPQLDSSMQLPSPFRLNAPRVTSCARVFPCSREQVEGRIIRDMLVQDAPCGDVKGRGAGEVRHGGRAGNPGKGAKASCAPTGSSINWNAGKRLRWQPLAALLEPGSGGGRNDMAGSDSACMVQSESTIGNSGFRLGSTRKTLQTDASVSRLSRLSLLRRHLNVLRELGARTAGAHGLPRLDGLERAAPAAAGDAISAERMATRERKDAVDESAADEVGKEVATAVIAVARAHPEAQQEGADASGPGGPLKGETAASVARMRYCDAKKQDEAYVVARHAFLEVTRPLGPWLVNDAALQQWSCEEAGVGGLASCQR